VPPQLSSGSPVAWTPGSAARRPGGPRGGNRVSRPGRSRACRGATPATQAARFRMHAAGVRIRTPPFEGAQGRSRLPGAERLTAAGPSSRVPSGVCRWSPSGDRATRPAFAGTRPPRLGHCACWAGFDWRGSGPLERRSFERSRKWPEPGSCLPDRRPMCSTPRAAEARRPPAGPAHPLRPTRHIASTRPTASSRIRLLSTHHIG
jgi:hypothetical protein